MSNIERAFLISTAADMDSPSVNEIATPVSAVSSPKGASCTSFHTQKDVGNVPQGMTDEEREGAICRAAWLVERLYREAQRQGALWREHGDFDSKAAFDVAYSNAHRAREIMESLIKGRSPEYVAFLERQRGLDLPACANEERAR